MAKTLANAQTITRIYLDEATQLDFLDSEINFAVNLGYQDVIGHVIEVYENFYETVNPITYAVVANQQEYTIDSSLIKVTRVEINFNPASTSSTPVRAIAIKSEEMRLNLTNTSATGSYFNVGYYLHGPIGSQKIGFAPIPTIADTGTGKSISVWGIQLQADLVNSTDDVAIPFADRYIYLVCLRAAAELLRKGQQEEKAARQYIAEYENGIKQMQSFLKTRQSDDGDYIIDSVLEDLDFATTGLNQ